MRKIFVPIVLLCGLLAACGKKAAPLSLEQLPIELKAAFQSASSDMQNTVNSITRQVDRKQFGPAMLQVQMLLSNPQLNGSQKSVVARALATINENLQKQIQIQEAASEPIPEKPSQQPSPQKEQSSPETAAESAAALNYYKSTK